MFRIFDLDGTVIDSSHRQNTRKDGTLDLDHWRENSTAELIFRDKLLPLAEMVRSSYANDRQVILCTARVLTKHDYSYLRQNHLPFQHVLSRPQGNRQSDPDLKENNLRIWAKLHGVKWKKLACQKTLFLDDSKPVLARMSQLGFNAVDATKLNSIL